MTLPSLLLPKIIIKKFDSSSTYFTYDGFSPPSSGARVTALEVQDSQLEAAPFSIKIEDSGGDLDSNVGNGNHVIIQLGASQDSLQNYVAGYIRQVQVDRADTGAKEYTLLGYTNLIRAEERILNYFRIADRDSGGEDPDTTDTTMQVSELFKDAFEDVDVYPLGQPLLPFTLNGVTTVSDFMASIKEPFVTMKDILDKLADSAGCVYGIDGSDDVFLRYATLSHSGITIKNTVGANDMESKTGYFVGPWSYTKSIKKSDGFANRLYGRGGTQLHLDTDEFTDSDSKECHSVDRAQQFTALAPNLSAISVIVSRTGTLANDIIGEIRFDDNDSPTGDIVGTFSIYKALVGTSATTVSEDVATHGGSLQVGTKYWLILKKQGDSSNYYSWHCDSGSSGTNATSSDGGSTWSVSSSSFTLTHRTYCSRRVLTESSSPVSINKYGVTEDVIDAPYIIEGSTMDLLLSSILTYSARQKMIFNPNKIWGPTVPINAGKLVRLVDTTSGLDMDAEIKSVKYSFKADENGLGTRWVDIEPISFTD